MLHLIEEVLLVEDQKGGVFGRHHTGRAGLAIEQRHFSEKVPCTLNGEDEFPAIGPLSYDLDLTGQNEVEGISRISLQEDEAAFGIGSLAGNGVDGFELLIIEPGEQRNSS